MATTPRVNTRSTRHALGEISRFVDGIAVVPNDTLHVDVNHENVNGILTPSPSPEDLGTRTRTRNRTPFLVTVHDNVLHGSFRPSPSPDEMVIRDRGRRQTFKWSPKTYRCLFGTNQTTPVKGTPSRGSVPLRSSPRKKLQLLETPSPSPVKVDGRRKTVPVSIDAEKSAVPLATRLQALSHEQLQGIICKITNTHPQLAMEVEELIPGPDLQPYEERLKELKKNIYGARTRSRLTTVTDCHAYQKASAHILAFKRSVIERSRTLCNCEQWASLLEYCMMAWQYVREIPIWDNPPHNKPRQACFSILVTRILEALKHATLDSDNVHQLITELRCFLVDSKDIQAVLDFLEKKHVS